MTIILNYRTDLVPSEEFSEHVRRIADSFLRCKEPIRQPANGEGGKPKYYFRVDTENQQSKYYARIGNILMNMQRLLIMEDAQIRISKGNSFSDYAAGNAINLTGNNSKTISYFIDVMLELECLEVVQDAVPGKSFRQYRLTDEGRKALQPISNFTHDNSYPAAFKSALTAKNHVTYTHALADDDTELLAGIYARPWTMNGKPVDPAPIRRVVGEETDKITSWTDTVDANRLYALELNGAPTIALTTPYTVIAKLAAMADAKADFSMFGQAQDGFLVEAILKVIRKDGDIRKAHASFVKTFLDYQNRTLAAFEELFDRFYSRNAWVSNLYGAEIKDLFTTRENLNIALQIHLAKNGVPAVTKTVKGKVFFIVPEDKADEFYELARSFFVEEEEPEQQSALVIEADFGAIARNIHSTEKKPEYAECFTDVEYEENEGYDENEGYETEEHGPSHFGSRTYGSLSSLLK